MGTMGMKTMKTIRIATGVLFLLITAAGISWGITAEELMAEIENGGTPTLIDVRDTNAFASGHLPNAINIPARLCQAKSIPPLGRVIVCGDGLRTDLTRTCVAHLNEKPGVTAEMLEGGFGRWEALHFPTTGKRGMKQESLPVISYDKLKDAVSMNPDIVLVDLRRPQRQALQGDGSPPETALTDLKVAFPGAAVVQSPFESSRTPAGQTANASSSPGSNGHTRLYVLIDSGDSQAEQTARHMKAAGIRRFFILLGGEEMLRREGKSGLSRLTR